MSLSAPLFDEVRPVFFRVLTGASAPVLIDILHVFERALTERPEGIGREDAIGAAEEVIASHPSVPVQEDDPGESAMSLRDRARLAIDRLVSCGWLEEQETTAWRRILTLEGNGALMLKALRQMAWPDAAVFSDKLSSVCGTLANPAMMEEQPWAAIESSISQAEEGLAELRGMGRSIQRHTKRQLSADSLKENLSEVFDRFAERIGRACYAELVRASLHTRLSTA
ncbi:MAG TPA: Wadjet anti-phage system protein JetA family protein, partial [Verrucomicrobiales bacterium]|nr:Wadjet anti-phage system protein JetA family protein [Verrucomicrobiales bacterium]